jgi:23S rRNA pseudouridine1911/1915/1917 synthase
MFGFRVRQLKKQKIKVYDDAFCRMDIWLHRNFPDLSRSVFARLIKQGHIRLNRDMIVKPSREIHPGDILEITWPIDALTPIEPQYLPLDVIYQDDQILVINKRAGISVHPAGPFQKGTLVNGLLYANIPLARYGAPLRPGIVHRLDRDTSGVMIVAKSDRAYLELIRMFKQREVKKMYLALVEGRWEGNAEVNIPIQRSERHPCLMEISRTGGKPALTEIEPICIGEQYSLLLVRPRTGRTHQIRVHLSSQGYPIAGDVRYGSWQSEKVINRQALHAFVISFPHPISGKTMIFAAALPDDFRASLKALSYPPNVIRYAGNDQ